MRAAGILAGDEHARHLGEAVLVELDAAHHVMRGRHDLDQPFDKVEADVAAAVDHALELLDDHARIEMRHGDEQPAIGAGAALAHHLVHPAADDVAGRPLAALVELMHEALLAAVQQVAAGARAGLPR